MEEGNWREDWNYEQGREKKERKAHTWWTSICCQNSVSSASSSNCSPAAIVCLKKKKSANTSQADYKQKKFSKQKTSSMKAFTSWLIPRIARGRAAIQASSSTQKTHTVFYTVQEPQTCEGLPVDDAIEISDRDINLLLLLLLSNPDDTTTDPEKEQEQFPNLLLHTSSLHTKLFEANNTGSSDDDDDDAEEIGGGGGEAPRLLLLLLHKSWAKAPDSSAVLEGKEEGILANAHIATGILIRGSRRIAVALDIYTPECFSSATLTPRPKSVRT